MKKFEQPYKIKKNQKHHNLIRVRINPDLFPDIHSRFTDSLFKLFVVKLIIGIAFIIVQIITRTLLVMSRRPNRIRTGARARSCATPAVGGAHRPPLLHRRTILELIVRVTIALVARRRPVRRRRFSRLGPNRHHARSGRHLQHVDVHVVRAVQRRREYIHEVVFFRSTVIRRHILVRVLLDYAEHRVVRAGDAGTSAGSVEGVV